MVFPLLGNRRPSLLLLGVVVDAAPVGGWRLLMMGCIAVAGSFCSFCSYYYVWDVSLWSR